MTNAIDAWSWSRLQCWEDCPALFKYRNIDKLDEPKGEPLVRGIKIHSKAEAYLKGSDPDALPPELDEFDGLFQELHALRPEVERRMGLTDNWNPTGFFGRKPKKVRLRMVLDVFKNYEDRTALVVDHKTGKNRGDNEDQMRLFADGVMAFDSNIHEVETRLWFLDSGEEVMVSFARDGLRERLEAWDARVEPMFNDTVFAPKPSRKCEWCHFRRSNNGPCKFG